jgi:hypothetical protein
MRSFTFFHSDVASLAEEIAYPLGEDFGLDEDQTAALAAAVEKAVHDFFDRESAKP